VKRPYVTTTRDIPRVFVHNAGPKMTKTKTKIPEYLPVSPLSLRCPMCHAKPQEVCEIASGGALEFVHVARIKAAAKLDAARKNRKT
jgi:hypothetical protein